MKSCLPLLLLLFCFSCSKEENLPVSGESEEHLTIFFVNDPHGQLNHFAKIKHLVDKERETQKVLLVSAGDLFSGNPIVDQYPEKGYPIIDLMNKTGFDVAVIGNHEYDYGLPVLKSRIAQAEFSFICANLDVQDSGFPQPEPFKTLTVEDLKITFLGFVETNGKPNDVIPSTHPWRVNGLKFQRYTEVAGDFQALKEEEGADVLVALTHLGTGADRALASQYPFLDVVIGGHSHQLVDEEVNGIPVVQAGANLALLGKMVLTIKGRQVLDAAISFIDLAAYPSYDQELMQLINSYNSTPEFNEVVGYAYSDHSRDAVGCFYTTALKEYMQVDVAFQNGGGIRAGINQGDITKMEIYNMDPFNNQSVVFTMTVDEIRNFLVQSRAGLHVTGLNLQWSGENLVISNEQGQVLPGTTLLKVGMNDYIPAVYETYFPLEKAELKPQTTAESIIQYLETMNRNVDYAGCRRYFQ